jgi:hypothetical protein
MPEKLPSRKSSVNIPFDCNSFPLVAAESSSGKNFFDLFEVKPGQQRVSASAQAPSLAAAGFHRCES